MNKRVGIVSLGCDKNRVDSEKLMAVLKRGGYTLTQDAGESEIIIINTCAFIAKARKESIDSILEFAQYKQSGVCEKLIVSGCLPQKHLDELTEGLEEVDAFIGTYNYSNICGIIDSLYEGTERIADVEPRSEDILLSERVLSTPQHYAYLKIADGCDNYCTYCTIPYIRGRYHSQGADEVVAEAKSLVDGGAKEIILVAQDITRYGYDRDKNYGLVELIRRLSGIEGLEWIRLMYCYPEMVTDELIKEISSNDKVCKYIDIPLQHIADGVLKRMNRRINHAQTVELMERIRTLGNGIKVRSTFIVGFPGETEADFQQVCDFLREYRLFNVGFFAYSREEGTPAAKMEGQVPEKEKQRRLKLAAKVQQEVAASCNAELVGKTLRVLYEGIDYDKSAFVGRAEYHAPDIDGKIFFTGEFADVGNYYNIKITGSEKYDLTGVMIDESAQ